MQEPRAERELRAAFDRQAIQYDCHQVFRSCQAIDAQRGLDDRRSHQVRQTLGTPLVVSLFRDSRWDYVYEFTRQGLVREHRTLTVYFVDDKLARWEGDEMPISIAELNKSAQSITAGEGQWSDPRSWWDQFLDIFKQK